MARYLLILLLAVPAFSQTVPSSYFGQQLLNSSNSISVSVGNMGKQSGAEWPHIEPYQPGSANAIICSGGTKQTISSVVHCYYWGGGGPNSAASLDAYVSKANANGTPMWFMMEYVPGWSNGSSGCGGGGGSAFECIGPVTDLTSMDNFIEQLATRYNGSNGHGTLTIFELANEPFTGEASYSGTKEQFAVEKNRLAADILSIQPSATIGCCGESASDDSFVSGGTMDQLWTASPTPLTKTLGFISFHAYPHHLDDSAEYVANTCVTDNGGSNEHGFMGAVNCVVAGMARNSVSSSIPIWMTEGSWGDNSYTTSGCLYNQGAWGGSSGNGCYNATDALKSAFVARYALLMWGAGVKQFTWYAADSGTFGALTAAAKTAWNQVYNWMVGSTVAACSGTTVVTCSVTEAGGKSALAVWNVTGPSSYTITAGAWADYKDLTGATNAISGAATSVTIGISPILLEAAPIGPFATLSAPSFTFGNQAAGTTSGAQILTITNAQGSNIGNQGLTFTSQSLQTGTQFSFTSGCTGKTIGPGSTCSLSLFFKPTAVGAQSDTLTLVDNASGSPTQTVSLSGTGTGSASAPTVTTTTATSISVNSATSGGTVTSNGGAAVTAEGVAYGLTANPTTPCTGSGTATPFTASLTGLTQNTLYHYRACATNSVGTGYGADQTFTTLIPSGGQCPAPAYSCFSTSLATVPNATTPNIGNLTGAGTTFTDPNFGAFEWRGTDSTFEPALPNSSFTVTGSGSGDESHWSLNDDRLIITDQGGRNFVASASYGNALAPIQVTPSYPSGLFTVNGGLFFGHNANTPYRVYSFGNGVAGTGSTFGTLIGYYDTTSTTVASTFTQLYSLVSDLNTAVGGTFGTVTWASAGESDQTDTDFAEGLSNNGGQAGPGACYVAVFRQGSGGRVLNICTSAITGSWGPTGPASTTICPGAKIHNVKMYKAGGTQGAVIVTLDGGTGCPTGGYVWFYNGTTVTPECTAQCGGHFTEGMSTYANQAANSLPTAAYWAVRSNTAVGSLTSIVPSYPTAGRPTAFDLHCGWNFIDDTYPFDCTTYKTDASAINGGWQNELNFFQPFSHNPIRILQTYNTGASNNFSVQIAVGSCSQDGNYCAYTSDWQGTLGSTAGASTCTLTTNCRGDVILAQLNVATQAATPTFSPAAGTFTGPLTVTPSDTTPGTVMCWNLTGSPKTNRVSGCAPGSTLFTGGIVLNASATVYVVAGGGGTLDSAVASAAYTINQQASAPVITPPGGTFVSTSLPTVSMTATGPVICYTVDGSTPATNGTTGCTNGTKYTTSFTQSSTATVKAISGGTGYTDGPVTTAVFSIVPAGSYTFTINGPVKISGTVVIQ